MNESSQDNFLFTEKAHFTKDLKQLIRPWLSFRAFVKFKTNNQYGKGSKCHFYGNEHRCTYNQCLHQKVPFILLNKLYGYNDLTSMIEKGFLKGKYISAQIYSRSNPSVQIFDVLHRDYYMGKLKTKTVVDPVFTESSALIKTFDQEGTVTELELSLQKILYYTIERSRLVISETPAEEKM